MATGYIPPRSRREFAPTKEFYIPKYQREESTLGPGDNSVSLYWNPDLKLKDKEVISLNVQNNEIPGTKTIRIEVIATDGSIGYKAVDYEVKN